MMVIEGATQSALAPRRRPGPKFVRLARTINLGPGLRRDGENEREPEVRESITC